MKNSLLYMFLFIALLASSMVPAYSQKSTNWKDLLAQANAAIENNDYSYAIYKLRKAWLAVPDKDLNSSPYKNIRTRLAIAFDKSPRLGGGKDLRKEGYSMQQLDKRIRSRESFVSGDSYSVKLRENGDLEFTLNGLDSKDPEPVCGNVKMTSKQAIEWKNQTLRGRKSLASRMPIVIQKSSPRYEEVFSLSQPLVLGQAKPNCGFDFSPFAPEGLKALEDLN